jgi:hypothetical protein
VTATGLLAVVRGGMPQRLEITITVPNSTPPGTILDGTVQIRNGANVVARPLGIYIEVASSAFKSPDPSKLVRDAKGMIFPVDQLLVVLPTQATKSLADQIASDIGAEIVGFASLSNTYQLQLLTENEDQLDALLSTLSADLRLDGVSKNFAFNLFSIATDLTNLESCHPTYAIAYTQVELIDAWSLIASHQLPPGFVNIGIIDSGIDRSHPEFARVSIRPFDRLLSNADTLGHGTSVGGIIGAGNDLTFSSCITPNDLQMNGFVSGVPNASYFLDVLSSQRPLFAAEFSPFVGLCRILSTRFSKCHQRKCGSRVHIERSSFIFAALCAYS